MQKMRDGINFRKDFYEIALVCIILSFLIYSSFGITNPWGNDHNGFLAKEKAHYAINYLKFGYIESGFGQKIFEGGSLDTYTKNYSYYLHHPMLLSLLVSFSFLIFGIAEWSLRIVPIIINIGIISFLYLFTKTYWNKRVAILTSFFAVFSPMFFFNRNLAAFELLALFFICMTLYFYIKWLTTNKRKYFYLIFLSSVIGSLSDWEFYLIIPIILIHYFVFTKKKNRNRKLLYLIPLSILIFCLYIAYVFLLTGSISGTGVGGQLWGNLLLRMNLNESAWIANITLPLLLQHIVNDMSTFFTPMFLFIPIIFFAILFYKIIKRRDIEKYSLPAILFVFYIAFLFIFSHMYISSGHLMLFLIPSMPLFAALLIQDVWIVVRDRKIKINIPKSLFCLFLAIFLGYYVYAAYPIYQNIYNTNNLYLPLNDFLSKNRDNIIVSFGEDSTFYQLRPYLDMRIVRDIRSKEDLTKLLNSSIKFGYFFTKEGASIDDQLSSYLMNSFAHKEMYDNAEERYLVFDLNNNT